jgi:hypothetical protein
MWSKTMTLKSLRRTALAIAAALVVLASSVQAGQAKVDVSGTWVFDVQTDAGAGTPTMTFKQDGEKITGHYTGTFGEADLTGTVKGSDITFSFSADLQGMPLTSTYKGTIDSATSMKGTLEITGVGAGTFTAKKK